jgi:hypothetical protein
MVTEFPIVFALYPCVTQLDFTDPREVFAPLPGAACVLASSWGGDLSADGGIVFAGDDYAQSVQRSIEYAPVPLFDSGRPELAPAHVLAGAQQRYERVRPARDAAVARAAARLA